MKISIGIFIPLIPFALGIILKALLDFNLATFIVKWFYWIPIRSIFRTNPVRISGKWEQLWHIQNSEKYPSDNSRKSDIFIKQLGQYIYGEFRSNNDEVYYVYGEIVNKTIVGKWADKENNLGYYGAFELVIVNDSKIEGIWIGHSTSNNNNINANNWVWNKKS